MMMAVLVVMMMVVQVVMRMVMMMMMVVQVVMVMMMMMLVVLVVMMMVVVVVIMIQFLMGIWILCKTEDPEFETDVKEYHLFTLNLKLSRRVMRAFLHWAPHPLQTMKN